MKIGILTFHRAHNYGAVLQCYALQETLVRQGHEVHVIDYRQPWIEDFYKFFSFRMLRRNSSLGQALFYLRGNLKKFIMSPRRRRYFEDFRDRFLNLTAPCTDVIPDDFDCYVIGSDQLWSMHCLGGVLDPVYMGGFAHKPHSKVIGYAISADIRSIDAMGTSLKGIVEAFDRISMREAEVAARIEALTGRHCPACLDPTLLSDASLWEPLIDEKWKSRNYVLVYEVRWKKETRGLLRRKAEELARRIGGGCEVIDISGMGYPVRDFVSLFKYARHVVTTSFHGVVFSLLFETPFHAFPLWDGYDLRYRELLSALGAESRMAGYDAELLPDEMDFRPLKESLADLRQHSLDFLSHITENGQ